MPVGRVDQPRPLLNNPPIFHAIKLMVTSLDTLAEFDAFVHAHLAAAVYFGGDHCGVCQALWPKLEARLAAAFPQLALARVEISRASALGAACGVFTVPVITIHFDGREWIRKAGAFALGALERDIARPYAMLFGEVKE
jgi:hypothetical protein